MKVHHRFRNHSHRLLSNIRANFLNMDKRSWLLIWLRCFHYVQLYGLHCYLLVGFNFNRWLWVFRLHDFQFRWRLLLFFYVLLLLLLLLGLRERWEQVGWGRLLFLDFALFHFTFFLAAHWVHTFHVDFVAVLNVECLWSSPVRKLPTGRRLSYCVAEDSHCLGEWLKFTTWLQRRMLWMSSIRYWSSLRQKKLLQWWLAFILS